MSCLARIALGVSWLAWLTPGPTLADPPVPFDHSAVGRGVLEKVIRPGYRRLAAATEDLQGEIERHCIGPGSAGRARIAASFDRIVEAWGRVEPLALGPATEAGRAERMLFWPDRRGLGDRQVAQALAERDASVRDAATLSGKSVALRGLGALDRVLFDMRGAGGDEAARSHRCGFAAAIIATMAITARELVDAWQAADGHARLWLEPGESNPMFASPLERTVALAKVLDRGLERVRDERLGGPLGFNKLRRKLPTPLPYSGRGVRLAKANVEGLRQLYVYGGLERGLAASTADEAVRARARRIAATLASVRDGLAGLDAHADPFADPSRTSVIAAAGAPLKSVRREAAGLMTLVAGVPDGFSVVDGD